jgi:hypothetical protein
MCMWHVGEGCSSDPLTAFPSDSDLDGSSSGGSPADKAHVTKVREFVRMMAVNHTLTRKDADEASQEVGNHSTQSYLVITTHRHPLAQ